jgi:hypothetical protein
MASAQTVIGFPAAVSTAKPAAASTKVRARCVFSAQRPLAMLLQSTLIQEYQKLGYSRVNASVRISTPTTAITELQLPNISGISKLAPKPGAPLQVDVAGGSANAPVDVSCAIEARVQIFVTATNPAGISASDRSVSTLIVRGTFR